MYSLSKNSFIAGLLFSISAMLCSGVAIADPPTRVARLSYMDGPVTFAPAGDTNWVYAAKNRPLATGDQLWVDTGGKAELQMGAATARAAAGTSITVLNLDNRMAQLQLGQGTLDLHILRIKPDQAYEVDTPNLALTIRQPGDYRLDVDTTAGTTTVSVRKGESQAYGEGNSFLVGTQQTCAFSGTGVADPQCGGLAVADDFAQWVQSREQQPVKKSVSARYVSPDVIGYQDLDDNGTWQDEGEYGHVWVPTVAEDWAPYRSGHWSWINPWGWTWVDDESWGFAPFHYGRWAHRHHHWFWIPGQMNVEPVYAPALVAFIGGGGFQLSISIGGGPDIGWFPLGPGDVYQPSYAVSRDYFRNVNVSNTVINNIVINNIYNNPTTVINYRNKLLPGAVTAVPTNVFVQSKPVPKVIAPLSPKVLAGLPVSHIAKVTPIAKSVTGGGQPANNLRPPVLVKPIISRTQPPPPPVPFSAQQSQLAKNPGKPLPPAAISTLRPAVPLMPRPIKVIGGNGGKLPLPAGTGIVPAHPTGIIPPVQGAAGKPTAQPQNPMQPGKQPLSGIPSPTHPLQPRPTDVIPQPQHRWPAQPSGQPQGQGGSQAWPSHRPQPSNIAPSPMQPQHEIPQQPANRPHWTPPNNVSPQAAPRHYAPVMPQPRHEMPQPVERPRPAPAMPTPHFTPPPAPHIAPPPPVPHVAPPAPHVAPPPPRPAPPPAVRPQLPNIKEKSDDKK